MPPQKTGNFTFKRLPNLKIQSWGLGSLLYYWLFPLYLSNSVFNCETWPKAISPLSIPSPETSWVIAQIYFLLRWHALPPPHHHLPLSSTTSTENMSQPSKEETKITRESYIRSCELARVSWLAKWDGYKVGSHAAETLLVWSAARPARWHAGWEMTTNHLPNVTETLAKTVWQVASWRPGGFVLSTPTVKLVEQIKCLIYLGIFELVWQEGEKKNVFLTATATRETTPASQVNTTPIFT